MTAQEAQARISMLEDLIQHVPDPEKRTMIRREIKKLQEVPGMKKPAGQGGSKLRVRLKNLLSVILPRLEAERNA